jgi:putative transcriptional regulator
MIASELDQPRRPGIPRVATPARGSIDVRALRLSIRDGIGTSQQSFANSIGVAVKTLRNWEQGRRQPTGPARVLLALIARDPWIVLM